MIHFRSHASGSSGNLYELTNHEGGRLLIECGIPLDKIKAALSFTLSGVQAVLLSHAHMDHAKAARKVMEYGVDVYCSLHTAQALDIASHHRCRLIADGSEVTIGEWTVRAFAVQHDCPGTLGFLVASGEDKLVYITDALYSPHRFKGLTALAIECNHDEELLRENVAAGEVDPSVGARIRRNHMSLATVLGMLRANDLSRCRQIHLLHLSSANSDAVRFKAEVERATGVETVVA